MKSLPQRTAMHLLQVGWLLGILNCAVQNLVLRVSLLSFPFSFLLQGNWSRGTLGMMLCSKELSVASVITKHFCCFTCYNFFFYKRNTSSIIYQTMGGPFKSRVGWRRVIVLSHGAFFFVLLNCHFHIPRWWPENELLVGQFKYTPYSKMATMLIFFWMICIPNVDKKKKAKVKWLLFQNKLYGYPSCLLIDFFGYWKRFFLAG